MCNVKYICVYLKIKANIGIFILIVDNMRAAAKWQCEQQSIYLLLPLFVFLVCSYSVVFGRAQLYFNPTLLSAVLHMWVLFETSRETLSLSPLSICTYAKTVELQLLKLANFFLLSSVVWTHHRKQKKKYRLNMQQCYLEREVAVTSRRGGEEGPPGCLAVTVR